MLVILVLSQLKGLTMKTTFQTLIIALGLVLFTACGGGGSSDSTESVTATGSVSGSAEITTEEGTTQEAEEAEAVEVETVTPEAEAEEVATDIPEASVATGTISLNILDVTKTTIFARTTVRDEAGVRSVKVTIKRLVDVLSIPPKPALDTKTQDYNPSVDTVGGISATFDGLHENYTYVIFATGVTASGTITAKKTVKTDSM